MSNDIVLADYKEISIEYYGQKEQLVELCMLARKTTPWASEKAKNPMTDAEVGYAIRRTLSMGLDFMNGKEVQVWKDRFGVNVQIAYTLMVEYASRLLPRMTAPQYSRLTPEELEEEGLPNDAIAYRCTLYKIDDLHTANELGLDKSMFAITGIGSALKQEYSGQYFAPNGRSPSWKVKKRAYVDAIRMGFGEPSRAAIIELRRALGWDGLRKEDWSGTQGLDSDDALALANENARIRRGEIAASETVRASESALYPDYKRGKNKLFLDTDKPKEEPVGDIDFDAVPEVNPETGEIIPAVFGGPGDAVAWAISTGAFTDEAAAMQAYQQVKSERGPKTAQEMRDCWVEFVEKIADTQETPES